MIITPILVCELRCDLKGWLRVTDEQAALYPQYFKKPLRIPVQAFHVQLPDFTLLVDAGGYLPSDPTFAIREEYTPPPPVHELLPPGKLDAVVLTHAHFDHILGVHGFPDVPIYLGKADVAMAEERVGPIAGLIPVEGELDLGHGVRILPCPGETPGHQAVLIEDALFSGDLFHHEVEFLEQDWRVFWADAELDRQSRARMLALGATLYGAHTPPWRP